MLGDNLRVVPPVVIDPTHPQSGHSPHSNQRGETDDKREEQAVSSTTGNDGLRLQVETASCNERSTDREQRLAEPNGLRGRRKRSVEGAQSRRTNGVQPPRELATATSRSLR